MDTETKALLEKHIAITTQRLLGRQDDQILLPPPPEEKAKGPIHLGTVVYHDIERPFGISEGELLQGLGIWGRSGAGKSNCVFGLLLELKKRRIPWLFLDVKRTARHLLPSLGCTVNLFSVGRKISPIQINPLVAPPGLDRRTHISHVTDILASAYTLGAGSKSLLQAALEKAYERHKRWPTLGLVREILENSKVTGRAAGWKVSAERALQSLTFSTFNTDTNIGQAELVRRLLESPTILELDGVDSSARRFVVEVLLLWLYHYRLQAEDREVLRIVVVLEEAHNFLHKMDHGREPLVGKLLRQSRELGIGVVVVDQHPSLLSSAGTGNAYTSISLNLRDTADVNRVAAMSLLGENEKRLLQKLPLGFGVVKLQGRWQKPALLKVPLVPIRKGAVTDAVLSKKVWNGRVAIGGSARTSASSSAAWQGGVVGPDAARLIEDCLLYPTDGVKERYERLGLSGEKGNRIKEDLIGRGLLLAARIPIGRTRRVVIRPTESGYSTIGLNAAPARESIEHEFWKYHYALMLRNHGYLVEEEAHRSGGRVDLLAKRGPEEQIAVEIETGASTFESNARCCVQSEFSKILIVATSEAANKKINERLGRAGLLADGRVEVVLRDSLPARWPLLPVDHEDRESLDD